MEDEVKNREKVLKIRFSTTGEVSVKQVVKQILEVHSKDEKELTEAR